MANLEKEALNIVQSALLSEIKRSYNELLDDTVELLKYYNCKTPQEIVSLITLLNKYYDKEYHDDYYCSKLETVDIMGVQAIVNGGVCRHKAAFLSDIYNKLNMDSIVLIGYYDLISSYRCYKNKSKIYFRPSRGSFDQPCNHAIVMVGDDRRNFVDPTNNVTLYKRNNNMKLLGNHFGCYFHYIPSYIHCFTNDLDLLVDYMDKYKKIMRLKDANESEDYRNIKKMYFDLKYDISNINNFLKNQKSLIERTKAMCSKLYKLDLLFENINDNENSLVKRKK